MAVPAALRRPLRTCNRKVYARRPRGFGRSSARIRFGVLAAPRAVTRLASAPSEAKSAMRLFGTLRLPSFRALYAAPAPRVTASAGGSWLRLRRHMTSAAQSQSQSHALNRDQFSKQAEPFARVAAHSHEPTMTLLLDVAGVGPGTRVLDVACGPGLVSLAAAERGALVTGADVTPACVAAAEAARARRGIPATRAAFCVAAAEALPTADGAFDVALSRYAFHHLARGEARARAVAEMARAVRGGGLVVICDVLIEGVARAAAYDALELLRDSSHAGVIEGGRAGGAVLLRGAGLELVEDAPAGYDFEAVAEDVVGASFPDSPAAAAEFMRRVRGAAASGGGAAVTAAASPLGIAVDASHSARTPYKVPIGIWVGRKRAQ